jgi:hypothetical protein
MGTKPWKAMVRKMTNDRVRVSAFEESVPAPSQQFATAEPVPKSYPSSVKIRSHFFGLTIAGPLPVIRSTKPPSKFIRTSM